MNKSINLIWHTEKRKVKDLKLFPGNPRRMTEKQAQDLLNSLQKFNLVEIPAINTDNVILAGNMRIQALQKLGRGDEEIDIRVPNRKLTDIEAKEYNLRSNRNVGEFDYDLLSGYDTKLLKEVGFEESELLLRDFSQYNQEDLNEIIENTNIIEIEFLPEDLKLFNEIMEKIKIKYVSNVPKINYGLKLSKLFKKALNANIIN